MRKLAGVELIDATERSVDDLADTLLTCFDHASADLAAEIAALRTRESGVTAWVCAEDHHAYQLIQRLEAAGLRVPQDCSVTGFGGIEPPAGLPRATSLRAPHEHIGSSALTRMVNRVMYPSSPRRKILVEAQFVPGETVAAPRRP